MKAFLLLMVLSFTLHAEPLSERILNALIPYPDFPKPGITFRDISPILEDADLFSAIIDNFYEHFKDSDATAVVALESRGFLFGAPLAYKLKIPLVMIRKEGKLPGEVYRVAYKKIYGEDVFILRKEALKQGDKVIVVDDFFSTGGSVGAAVKLVEAASATVIGGAFLINNYQVVSKNVFPFPIYTISELKAE